MMRSEEGNDRICPSVSWNSLPISSFIPRMRRAFLIRTKISVPLPMIMKSHTLSLFCRNLMTLPRARATSNASSSPFSATVPVSCHVSGVSIAANAIAVVCRFMTRRRIPGTSRPEFSFWQFCPDRYIIVVPQGPLYTDTVDLPTLPVYLAGDGMGDEIERGPGLGCG